MRDIQPLHGTERHSEIQPAIIRDIWDRKDSERQPVTMGERERHAATTWRE